MQNGVVTWMVRMTISLSLSPLQGFLTKHPARRLGCNPTTGEDDIKGHVFFKTTDWVKLEARQIRPPYKPKIVSQRHSHTHTHTPHTLPLTLSLSQPNRKGRSLRTTLTLSSQQSLADCLQSTPRSLLPSSPRSLMASPSPIQNSSKTTRSWAGQATPSSWLGPAPHTD